MLGSRAVDGERNVEVLLKVTCREFGLARCEKPWSKYPISVCFAGQLIFSRILWLRNQTPLFIQRRLHLKGSRCTLML